MRLEALREELVALHAELPRHGLVAWTGGNISARDPETGLVAIKPSGVRYDDLTADSMVVARHRRAHRRGRLPPVVRHGEPPLHLPPSARRQRRRPHPLALRDGVRRGRPADPGLPDRPGRRVRRRDPVRRVRADRRRGDRDAGRRGDRAVAGDPAQAARRVHDRRRPPTAAVKSAVMVEDIAATVWAALQIGTPERLPDDVVERLHRRYTTVYGQRPPSP